jgi:hypothetical protein
LVQALEGELLEASLKCGTDQKPPRLNALMLANLGLDVSTCIAHIGNVSYNVFGSGTRYASRGNLGMLSPKYSAKSLENALLQIEGTDLPILNNSTCKRFVEKTILQYEKH